MIETKAFSASSPVSVEITGSRTPSTMNETGLYSAMRRRRLLHQLVREERRGEEEDHEDEREQALDDRRRARADRDGRADPSEGHRGESVTNTIMRTIPRTPSSICAPKMQAEHDVVDGRERAERGGSGKAAQHHRKARDRSGQEAVGEAHLDVDRERDAARVAREQAGLDHRPGEHEVEEAVHLGKAGQVDGAPRRRRSAPPGGASGR